MQDGIGNYAFAWHWDGNHVVEITQPGTDNHPNISQSGSSFTAAPYNEPQLL